MLFPTLTFAVFFSLVFPLHWVLRGRPIAWRLFMLGASYVFYGWWDWRFVSLIVLATVVNQAAARGIAALHRRDARRGAKIVLAAALAADLGLLGVFKYAGFFSESLNTALTRAGLGAPIPLAHIILPVGISFFTFQAISYVVDVYRRELAPAAHLDFAVYLAFFPQLVAGPIVRASEMLPQLSDSRGGSSNRDGDADADIDADGDGSRGRSRTTAALTHGLASRGALLIAGGLFKKVVVSTYLAQAIVDPVFAVPGAHTSPEILLAIYGYAVQIYADFSGYTDIAIGVAALLGFEFPQNFDRPYAASSLRDFWRRWHMTLSRWLRDYLYIPLGGSRAGRLKTHRNLLLTMGLGGLWHGAAFTFLGWGLVHGLGLSAERVGRRIRERQSGAESARSARTGRTARSARYDRASRESTSSGEVFGRLVTFHVVCLGWVLFRAESFGAATAMLSGLIGPWHAGDLVTPTVAAVILAALALQQVPRGWSVGLETGLARLPVPVQGAVFGLVGAAIVHLGPDGVAPFIYFRF